MTKVEKIELAAKLLNVPVETLTGCCGEITEANAMYFSVPEKAADH